MPFFNASPHFHLKRTQQLESNRISQSHVGRDDLYGDFWPALQRRLLL
jgi:hypothetical protein